MSTLNELVPDWDMIRCQENADIYRLRAQQALLEAEIANVQLRSCQERNRLEALRGEVGLAGLASAAGQVTVAMQAKNEIAKAGKPAGRPKNEVSKKAVPAESGAKPKRVLSPAARKKIAEAQKKRWASYRAEKGGGGN